MRTLVGFVMFAQGWAFACANSFFDKQPLPWYNDPAIMGIEVLQRRLEEAPSDKLPEFKAWYREQRGFAPGALAEPEEDEYLVLRDMLTGNHDAAVERSLSMEAAEPGDYSTAANLGTAYELAGDNAMAHFWITKGIEHNPESHYGTEWLHLRILETKIAMEDDPNYLQSIHIIPVLESGNFFRDYRIETSNGPARWNRVKIALRYQLSERMLFVKPQDPVVADLLYSAARLHGGLQDWREAAILLELAREYGYYDTTDLETWLASYRTSYWRKRGMQVGAGLLMAGAALFLMYRFFWCFCRLNVLMGQYGKLREAEELMGQRIGEP